MMEDKICIQDKYDKQVLARRYGNVFDCNNCGRNWIACKDDILEGYEQDVKLRCPYCHNLIIIPRNYDWD